MDLKTLILLLENKIKTKDFILPYNSKSLDASTIQTLNQNLSSESLEKMISQILQQNVNSVIKPDLYSCADKNISKGLTESHRLTSNNNIGQNLSALPSSEPNGEYGEYGEQSPLGGSLATCTEKIKNLTNDEINYSENLKLDFTDPSIEIFNGLSNKNTLLFNFLMFSNKQVLEYVKTFSGAGYSLGSSSLDPINFTNIANSYNQLINFLGYYKISFLYFLK